MEIHIVLGALGLLVCLPVIAAILISSLRPGGRRPYLAIVLAEAGTYFASAIIESLVGATVLSLALNYCCSLWGLPALYLFSRPAGEAARPRAWRHFLPAAINAPLGVWAAVHYHGLGLHGDALLLAYYLALLLAESVQLFAYGRAWLAAPSRSEGGTALWSNRVGRAVLIGYGIIVLVSWLSIAWDLLGSSAPPSGAFSVSGLLTMAFLAWTIGLCLLWGRGERTSIAARKYGGRAYSPAEAEALVARVRAYIASKPDLASAELEPRRMAEALGLPYYLLSRAVNEGLEMTLADLVNEYRVERAKALLAARPELSILDVALESGFVAKSTFNDVFKRKVGASPSEYRARR
jgi:AraC-type DNA-binding domain-containing proteins